MPNQIILQIEEWKKRLIDLTRRNQLIFFDLARRNLLEIKQPDSEFIFDKLNDEKEFNVWLPPDKEEDDDEKVPSKKQRDLFSIKEIKIKNTSEQPKEDDIVFTSDNKKEIEKRLKIIFRRASSDYQEKGLRTSVIALGLLHWKEKDSGEEICSPLLLYPIEIKQATPEEPYKIAESEEEVILNPAIQVKLNWDFKIDLPLPDFASESWNIEEYFRNVEKIGKRVGWKVENRVFLSIFTFHKIAMYQDLTVNASLMAHHPIIKGLTEGYLKERSTVDDVPDQKDLDDSIIAERMLYILDADSSQAKAIETAIKGHSFVLKGPPGTGKSQTICNVIGEFLEAGKTVLFVSEKMAALEVVFNRLKEAHLTDFCLELHSHKAKKKEVVRELMRCLEFRPTANRHVSHSQFEKLLSLRQKLNSYIKELHKQREPLGESLYDIFAKMFKLEKVPQIAMTFDDISSYAPPSLQSMEDLIIKLKNNYVVLEEGEKFPWRGFRPQRLTPQARIELINLLEQIKNNIYKSNNIFSDYVTRINIDQPKSLAGCQWVINIANILFRNPAPMRIWLEQDKNELIAEAEKYYNLHKDYLILKDVILSEFSPDFLSFHEDFQNSFKASWDKVKALLPIGDPTGEKLISIRKEAAIFLESTRQFFDGCLRDVKEIKNTLGLNISDDFNLERARQVAELGILVFAEHRPEKFWFDPILLNKVEEACKKLRVYIEKYYALTTELAKRYDKEIYVFDLGGMVHDFDNKYKTFTKYFLPKYYSDRNLIRKISKTGKIPESILEDLKNAREVNGIKNELDGISEELKQLLGSYFNDFNTNLESIEMAQKVASKIIHLVGELPIPVKMMNASCLGGITHPDLQIIAKRLQRTIAEWEVEAAKYTDILLLNHITATNLSVTESPISGVKIFVDDLKTALLDFDKLFEKLLATKNNKQISSCSQVMENFEQSNQIKCFERRLIEESRKLNDVFGHKFSGIGTDWQKIIESLIWTKEFIELTKDVILPDEFIANVCNGIKTTKEELQDLEEQYKRTKGSIDTLESKFDNTANFFSKISFSSMAFDEIIEEINKLIDRIDNLQQWFDYVDAALEMKKAGLFVFLEKIALNPLPSDTLMHVFHKAFYQSWIDKVCAEVSIVGEFRGVTHNSLIQEFRKLDKELSSLSPALIIEKLNELKPRLINIQGSEVAKVRNEAAKKTRHWPLRKLFAEIPNLLPRLKPCLLMSPLSVSHFLDQTKYKFDLVIFDEASQICSEDAVGAIARGKQLVVTGDNRQLPPTKFFQGDSFDDEEYSEETPDAFGIYQSVLDDCERIGLTPQPLMLEWHYRSKHESLIAYSNSRFYGNKLVTFPCAKDKDEGLGIKFEYVHDGIFDRGGKRNNLREAEIVANLVIDHFSKYGNAKTLGVATLNLPQKDAILDILEQKRKERPDLSQFFQEDRLSGFFVKNLEAVQGDERDIIILSLGYGKDANNRFTMNFGPINKDGGERRLNVIVTRAKEKIILVSSIKAADFNLDSINSEGVRHLYHYLDYAERGKEALSLGDISGGEVESPFEEDVKNEIKALGYEVLSQIGCSSFRIDLGVIDLANPGCFILGVECDGRTYHSAFTARERDRIRQDVLQSLGWRIHRIWSPDWFYRKKNEIDRLRTVLEEASKSSFCIKNRDLPPNIEILYQRNKTEDFKSVTKEIIEYKCFRYRRLYSAYEFNLGDSGFRRHEMLKEIVKQEGPIHIELAKKRLIAVWGIGRIGPIIDETLDKTIKNCIRENLIYKKGNFLWDYYCTNVACVKIPDQDNPDTFRDPEFICEEEIQLAIVLIVKRSVGIEKESLFIETARLFGWKKNNERVENIISKAFNSLVKKENLVIKDNQISLRK